MTKEYELAMDEGVFLSEYMCGIPREKIKEFLPLFIRHGFFKLSSFAPDGVVLEVENTINLEDGEQYLIGSTITVPCNKKNKPYYDFIISEIVSYTEKSHEDL